MGRGFLAGMRLPNPKAPSLVLIMIAMLCPTLAAGEAKEPSADLVLVGGKIATLDPARPQAQALAVRSDRIVAVGDDGRIRALIDPETEVIELDGKRVVPGFIEGHGHFMALGEARMQLDLRSAEDFGAIARQVAQAAAAAQPGEWIVGRGWHQEKWRHPPRPQVEGLPLHTALSRAAPDNPVMLIHASGHSLLANARAMALAGVSAETADPDGGQIVRGPDGVPIGAFRESACGLIERAHQASLAARTPAQVEATRLRAIQMATRECQAKGVTSFQDAGASLGEVALYRRLAEEHRLGLRLWVMLNQDDAVIGPALDEVKRIGPWLTVRAIKRFADGALGSHGAWLLAPYSDTPDSSGLNVTPMEDIAATARLALEHGFQLCVHAIGDRANREVLDVYQRALAERPDSKALRWRIEHAQHLDPADIPRFAQLGVVASMQAVHCTSDGPWVPKRLGTERAREGAYAWRALLDTGAVVSNGTDTPVEDVDPIAGFYALVTRRMADGRVFFGEQRMSRAEALAASTRQPAFAAFEESSKGSLKPGMLADLVVLSQDLLTVPEKRIRDTQVLITIVGGRVVYRADAPDGDTP